MVWIQSNDESLHIEMYYTGVPDATTIVFSHGITGYARLMLPFIMPLFEKGYNIIAPDLKGYGYNKGRKGDFCIIFLSIEMTLFWVGTKSFIVKIL